MGCDFDEIIDRANSDSAKWCRYGEDVLPLWVADMDFAAPELVICALQERVAHGIYGYGQCPEDLRGVVQERLSRLYAWQVEAEDILFLPGVVRGFNLACHAIGSRGDEVLVEVPSYPPMLTAPKNAGRTLNPVPLIDGGEGYGHDLDQFEQAITERTSLFLLSNPFNPVGRVFERGDLERLAEICLRNNIVICSDEIHSDIVFRGHQHVPVAALDPEVAKQTITLFSPSKTFNIAGLSFSVGVVQNPELREKLTQARQGLMPGVSLFGYVAGMAAYQNGQEWLDELLVYLEANRDYLLATVAATMPGIKIHQPEGTFLAWLDCRDAGVAGNPHEFFLEHAKVALNDGIRFGAGGEGFVRLNFGCPRATLSDGLERMRVALEAGSV